MNKSQIVIDAIHKFPALPAKTISRYILAEYGMYFDGDLEKIRDMVRYRLGSHGDRNRERIGDGVIKRAPATMPRTWRRTRGEYHLDPGKWLVLSDIHVPYHEPKALEAAFEYGKAQNVDGVLLNGDAQDCAAVGMWSSTVKRNFDGEVESFIEFLDYLDQEFPNAKKVYKPGNHEYRLPRMYANKAPELIGMPLMAMDVVLGLEYRGIEFLEYKQIVMAGKLAILHGDEYKMSTAVNPARGLFLKAKTYAACGHFHSTSEHSTRNVHGDLISTWSFGCLCDMSPDYAPYNDWNWGFAVVTVDKSGKFKVDNRKILPDGEVV